MFVSVDMPNCRRESYLMFETNVRTVVSILAISVLLSLSFLINEITDKIVYHHFLPAEKTIPDSELKFLATWSRSRSEEISFHNYLGIRIQFYRDSFKTGIKIEVLTFISKKFPFFCLNKHSSIIFLLHRLLFPI